MTTMQRRTGSDRAETTKPVGAKKSGNAQTKTPKRSRGASSCPVSQNHGTGNEWPNMAEESDGSVFGMQTQ